MSSNLTPQDIAECIYAACGDSIENNHTESQDECWTINITKEQVIAHENIAKFRVHATHPNAVHISTASTITVMFNDIVRSARFEGFDVEIIGTTVILKRQSHANAYTSLDQYDSLLEITCDNPDTVTAISYTIECTKDYNVQVGI